MSWKYLIQEIEIYLNGHPSNPKFFAEFEEQRPNLATKDEKYPLVFVVPSPSVPSMNVVNFTVEIQCFDLLKDDRSNVNDVLSETWLILNDIYQFFNGNHPSIDISVLPTFNPLNNFDLDYVAGWSASFDFELPQYCDDLINTGN